MLRRYMFALCGLLLGGAAARSDVPLDVKTFGAIGDGVTLATAAIQKAIDKAYNQGGGVITVPAGTFKIGTLILKDHCELHLEPGAVLLGSPDIRDYATVVQKYESRTRDLYARYFMLFAEGAKDISVTGQGTMHGNGLEHFQKGDPQNLRPFMVRFVNCQDVTIRDLHLLESANWTLHLLGCRDVNIDGIVIENGVDANRDGLDIDCCQRVTVSNSRFNTGDDAIVMKTTNDDICQDIAITNCIIRTRASAIKTGTESNGGFKNITVSNCVIKDVPRHAGIELMTVDGGTLQNVLIENIAMDSVATPFFVRVGIRSRPYKVGQYVSKIDDVTGIVLRNISVTNAKLPSSIMGLHDRPIKNVTVSGYSVRYQQSQKPRPYDQVPFEEFSYPAANVFKNLPAFGIYCRNAEQLRLEDISMFCGPGDARPALVLDRVKDADVLSVRARLSEKDIPLAHLRNDNNVTLNACKTLNAADKLFEVEEGTCETIKMVNNSLGEGQQELVVEKALPDPRIFEDFKTDIRYTLDHGDAVQGFPAHDLGKAPLKIKLEMSKRGVLQLCLLMLNDGPAPEKVLLSYEGITQEFRVDWTTWGWAPISLLKQYDASRAVEFEIRGADQESHLKVARAYLRYQDLGHTD